MEDTSPARNFKQVKRKDSLKTLINKKAGK
jgi:hypothetical protein